MGVGRAGDSEMLTLLSNPVTTETVEVKTKKLQNRVKSPRYFHPATRLQGAAIIIELSPQQNQQRFDRSQLRAQLTLVSQFRCWSLGAVSCIPILTSTS